MWADISALIRIDGTPSTDGNSILVKGKLETGSEIAFALDLERASWLIAKLADWIRRAAKKSGWSPPSAEGQEDKGVWIRPTSIGLVGNAPPNLVHMAVDVGPLRLRFELPKSMCHKLGIVLQKAAQDSQRR